MVNHSPIIDRLGQIRRVARRRLLMFGIFAVMAGGIAALITIVLVDWLVWLPPILRIVAGIIFVLGFLGATRYWIVTPLRAQLTLQELAGKIERHFPPLQDRLASSVNFLERGDAGSSPMAQHVVAATQDAIESLRLEDALVGGPVTRRGLAFVATLALLMATFWSAPGWLGVGIERYWRPWSGIEWPRSVSITPITSNQLVAMGDSATVSMRVARGRHESLRAVVHFGERGGAMSTLTLRDDGDGTYSTTIDTVTGDLVYWFEAGDDTTEKQPASINVVRRPEVVEATALVEAPSYASNAPSRVVNLREGPAQAVIGGAVTIHIRASKNIVSNATDRVGIQSDTGDWFPLEVDDADPTRMAARWRVARDLQFRVLLQDEHGFENRGADSYSLRALPDALPEVIVVEPSAVCEVTPTGSVRVVVRADDDFGIEQVSLAIERPSHPDELIPVEITARAVTSGSGVQVVGVISWAMASLSASPGDIISYKAVAQDNFQSEELVGQVAFSSQMRIRIISESEFQLRIREDLSALEERLRRTAFDQAALHDETAALQLATKNEEKVGEGTAGSISLAQLRMIRQVRETATRFDEIVSRIERNDPQSDERNRVTLLGENLRNVAAGPMSGASAMLGRAREPGDQARTQAALGDAMLAQQSALKELRDLLRSMAQWGAFQGAVARTQDLLDRQKAIRQQTAELGRSTLGKPTESMDPGELGALRENERKQKQLLDDVKEHLGRLEQLRQSLGEKDPTAAEALDAAMRSARAEDLMRHVNEATEAIASNRAGAAETHQRAAALALQKMLEALHEREDRELAQLRKRLDDAARQVEELIEEQNIVLAQTRSSDSLTESQLEAISGEQRTLSRNAKFLAGEFIDVDATAEAGLLVRQSATPMTNAENELLAGDAHTAAASEEEAIKLLGEARETLLAAGQDAAEEMLRRTLADIHEDLAAILAAQQAINDTMAQLADVVKSGGRLNRSQSREVARLTKEQLETRALVAALLPDIEQAAVYRWALERVARWMAVNHDSLEAANFDEETLAAAARIVRELENLIAALIQTQSMPLDTEFTEAGDSSGGASSDDASSPALPSMTELLVLKSLQDDINLRTAALYIRFDAQNPTEQSLRELTVLGEDQTQVQRLAQMVTDRVRRQ